MTLGAEPKKIAVLGVLLLAAAATLYVNVFSGEPESAPAPRPAQAPVAAVTNTPPPVVSANAPPAPERARSGNGVSEFKPRQGYVRPEDKPDPATIDPALRLDLLAKVQSVELEGASRNLFQYGPPPAPKPVELPKAPPKIPIATPQPVAPTPPPTAPVTPVTPPAPKAPPMTFKYYGYKVAKTDGRKLAFLLDGDEIIIAGESDPVKAGRYKVVRIGVNSITIEDTQFKSEETLKLQEDAVV